MLFNPQNQKLSRMWNVISKFLKLLVPLAGPAAKKISKGEVRISTKPEGQGAKGLAWHYAICCMEFSPSTQVEKLLGWETLPDSDQAALHSLVKKVPSSLKSALEDEQLKQSSAKAGAKQRKDIGADQKSKVAKAVGDVSTSRSQPAGNSLVDEQDPKASDLETKLDA